MSFNTQLARQYACKYRYCTNKNSKCQKLLGINIDSKLTFEDHINRICKKASVKLNALSRISYYMDPLKRRLLANAFFTSQFNYGPLSRMFHSRKLNNKINRLNERCLRLIYSDRISSYEELLDEDNSVSIHRIFKSQLLKFLKHTRGWHLKS